MQTWLNLSNTTLCPHINSAFREGEAGEQVNFSFNADIFVDFIEPVKNTRGLESSTTVGNLNDSAKFSS